MNGDTNNINNSSQEEISYQEAVPKIPSQRHNRKKINIPWRHIFTSSPFWAIFLCTIPQTYGGYTLLLELPNYLSHILHYNINEVRIDSCPKYSLRTSNSVNIVFLENISGFMSVNVVCLIFN